MKTCTKCNVLKELSEFTLNRGRRRAACRSCHVQTTKKSYVTTRERYLERSKEQRKKIRAFVDEKKRKPCMDCGVEHATFVMEFDHRPGTVKHFELASVGGSNRSLQSIQKEIDKCDLVCANCHRYRTRARKPLRVA